MDKLDRQNPTPLYYQLMKILKEKIQSDDLEVGGVIPTEKELGEIYNISRSTVRQAVLLLVNEGFLKREKAKGTIVISQSGRNRYAGGLISFTEEMDKKRVEHSTKILDQKIIQAGPEISNNLQLRENNQVYYLKRVRRVNDQPFIVDEHYIPYHLCPGIEQLYQDDSSLYQILRNKYQFNLHHGNIEIEVLEEPDNELMGLLAVDSKTSLLKAERTVYSKTDIPLDYFTAVTCGKFSIDVVSEPHLQG